MISAKKANKIKKRKIQNSEDAKKLSRLGAISKVDQLFTPSIIKACTSGGNHARVCITEAGDCKLAFQILEERGYRVQLEDGFIDKYVVIYW